MTQIESRISINAPLPAVWQLAQDIEKLPSIMPDLDKVVILERETVTTMTRRVVSEWEGRIRQFNRRLNWTEEDIWNDEDYTCRFWQLKGDFDEYGGTWTFSANENKTDVHLLIDYRFEIPLIGSMMQKVVRKLMQANCDGMLGALQKEAERKTGETTALKNNEL